MTNNLLTVSDAAEYVRLAEATLNQKRSNGMGPIFCRLGGRIFYRKDDLDSWISERRFTSTAEARGHAVKVRAKYDTAAA
jgi:hypothetical protein